MHMLLEYRIHWIWRTCTCTKSISRGAAHICFSLIVMCTVISFSRPHVCPEMDQVQNSNPSKFPCPCLHRHQYSASRSPAASPLTQTPGKKMGTIESCHPTLINSVSCSHVKTNIPVCILLKLCSSVFLSHSLSLLLLPVLSIPRRKHTCGFDQSCPI